MLGIVLLKIQFSKTEFPSKACAPVAKGLGGRGAGARCPRQGVLGLYWGGDTHDIAEPTYKGFNQLLDKNPTAYKGFHQLQGFQPTYLTKALPTKHKSDRLLDKILPSKQKTDLQDKNFERA